MSAAKTKAFDATPEAPLRTNWKVLGAFGAACFAAGGIYFEMRSLRAEVDKMAGQMDAEYRLRFQMQQDIRELSLLIRAKEASRTGKISQNDRD